MKTTRIFARFCLYNMFVINVLIFVSGFHTVRSDSLFKKRDSLQGTYLNVYDIQEGVESTGVCAVMCGIRRFVTPQCKGFKYKPNQKKCKYLTMGSDSTSTNIDAFVLSIADVFHDIQIGDHKFSILLSSMKKTFSDARTHCHDLGGYLLEFDSLEEYDAVKKVVTLDEINDSAFIGIYQKEGTWMADKEGLSFIPRWDIGEPDNDGGSEDCGAVIFSNMLMKNVKCDKRRVFLCEKLVNPS